MTSAKDDEDFWYSSEKRSFCFENNEVKLIKLTRIITLIRTSLLFLIIRKLTAGGSIVWSIKD